MSDYTILKRTKGQKIPRPFARTCSLEEAAEVLGHYVGYNSTDKGDSFVAKRTAAHWVANPDSYIIERNIDTDRPAYVEPKSGAEFFIFGE